MVMTFFVAELAALFFVFGKERERKEREPVTGEMRRNAGEDRAGTQGWLRQEVMRRRTSAEVMLID